MPLSFFARARTGALVNRLTVDLEGVHQALMPIVPALVGSVLAVVFAGGAMLALSWQVAIAVAVMAGVSVTVARRAGRRITALTRRQAQAEARLASTLTERSTVAGALLVKLFGRPEGENAHFAGQARDLAEINVRISMSAQRFAGALVLVSALAQALAYGLGGALASERVMSPGAVVTLSLLLTRLYGPVTTLSGIRATLATAQVSFERIFELLDLPHAPHEQPPATAIPAGSVAAAAATGPPTGPLTGEPATEPNPPVPAAAKPAPPPPLPMRTAARGCRVEFRQVHFRYPAAAQVSLPSLEDTTALERTVHQPVLRDISCTLPPGHTTALTGPSGAGKTTLALLIPRIHDATSGTVLVDGTDIRDIPVAALRDRIGVVTQDTHLFHDTLAANLRYACPHASDRRLRDALHRARLTDLLDTLPHGLDTMIGEHGHHLSGGEKQRLAIARLLLKDPRIAILDEATAHLDTATETALQHALAEALADRTTLVIAHRLSTTRNAAQILVLNHGTITEHGTHTQLIAAGGHYARTYRDQNPHPSHGPHHTIR
jgi:ATP-binding cassette subfamily B protein